MEAPLKTKKPTYKELEQRVRHLEEELCRLEEVQAELLKKEGRLRMMADLSYYWEAWRAEDGRYLYVSPSCERITGYKQEEFIRDPGLMEKIVHPADHDTVSKHLLEELEKTEPAQLDFRIVTSAGEERWIRHSCSPVFSEDGARLGHRSSSRDLTFRKETEEAFHASEEKYRSLFNESRDAIYITTREGRFLDVNQALVELFGYTRQELLERFNVRHIYADPAHRERFQREIEDKGSVRDYEVVFRKKDGTPMPCLLTSTVRTTGEGEILGYQGMIRDITTYRLAQEALRDREARYRAMVEGFDGLIYICSQDFRVEFMNRRLIDRTGYEAVGEFCYKALHNLDAVCPWCVNERVFRGETVRWEVLSPKDGRWYYVVNSPIHHADGRISKQAMILDITDRKSMEEALKESTEKTKRFAYSISHDLKSPAVGIYGLTRRLHQNYAAHLDEKGRSYCDQILKTAEQIAALAEQIMLYISSRENPLHIEHIKLKEITQMIREEFSPQLSIRGVRWVEPDILPEIRADRLCVLRVLRNLVDNALKYAGDELSEILLDYAEEEGFHVLSLRNDGAAIDPDVFERIFKPFERDDPSRGIKGVGLGLAIVRELLERHGGKAWVCSSKKEGTTFFVSVSKAL
jgi:PAS domain S-box-containing protein